MQTATHKNLSTAHLTSSEVYDAVKHAIAHLEAQNIEWWAILTVMEDIARSRGQHQLAQMLVNVVIDLSPEL